MKTVSPHSFAELDQLLWEIHQQRITPANAAPLPLAHSLPLAPSQDFIILLRVAITMLQDLPQVCPGSHKRRRVLHAAQVERSKCWLQFQKRAGNFVSRSYP